MAKFDYAALDVHGQPRIGVVAAPTLARARELLEGRRLLPTSLEPASEARAERTRDTRLSGRDLGLFTRQLATLVETAPLEEALRTIASQSDRKRIRSLVGAVHAGLLEGQSLSSAMAQCPKAFPALYRAMVAAGEGSGALPQILQRMAELQEGQQQVRAKLISALVYPAALAITAVCVVIALMTFVVPKVVEQFDSLGRELPLLTRLIIGISDLIVHWGLAAGIALTVLVVVAARLLAVPAWRLRADRRLLQAPLLGRMLRDLHAARMARTLAIMLGSGLPLMEGLSITARTVHNRHLRLATEEMAGVIREGGSLSAAMKRAGVFPPTLLYMTSSGESSGRLAPMLERAADYLEREFGTFTSTLMNLLEPAIIVLLGGVVAAIVLSILLPILQFNSMAIG